MKTMTVGEFKAQFSEVVEAVRSGETIAVSYGRKKGVIGYFQPDLADDSPKIKLGLLEGKVKFTFQPGDNAGGEELPAP